MLMLRLVILCDFLRQRKSVSPSEFYSIVFIGKRPTWMTSKLGYISVD